jgi:hypothetical protein
MHISRCKRTHFDVTMHDSLCPFVQMRQCAHKIAHQISHGSLPDHVITTYTKTTHFVYANIDRWRHVAHLTIGLTVSPEHTQHLHTTTSCMLGQCRY